jgi:hypothetical protein
MNVYPNYNYFKWALGPGPQNLIKMLSVFYLTLLIIVIILYRIFWISPTQIINYYSIDNDCSPFDNVRLCWLNRLGGYDSL